MKFLKLYLSIFILFFSLVNTLAQSPPCVDGWDCTDDSTTGGPGAQKVPINDNAPILVILGITVAGVVIYRNKQRQVN